MTANQDLIKSVLVELLGKGHNALKSTTVRTEPKQHTGHFKEHIDPDHGLEDSADAFPCRESLRDYLVEATGAIDLLVKSFRNESQGNYEAEVKFPCDTIDYMYSWVEDFERATRCVLRPMIVERTAMLPIMNIHKARQRCALKSLQKRISSDGTVQYESVDCHAGVTMSLRKDGFAHISIDMIHNHSLKDDAKIWSAPHISSKQRQFLIDLFKAGLTPVQVLDYLKCMPLCGREGGFPVASGQSSAINRDGFTWPYNLRNLTYHQVYHTFKKFKQQSVERKKDLFEMRNRLEKELDMLKMRIFKNEMLMASAQCFIDRTSLLSDQELGKFLLGNSQQLTEQQKPQKCRPPNESARSSNDRLQPVKKNSYSSVFTPKSVKLLSGSAQINCQKTTGIDVKSNRRREAHSLNAFEDLISFHHTPKRARMEKAQFVPINQALELGCNESPLQTCSSSDQPLNIASDEIIELEDPDELYPGHSSPIEILQDECCISSEKSKDDNFSINAESAGNGELMGEVTPRKEQNKTALAQKAFMETLLMSGGKRLTPTRKTNFITPTKATPKDFLGTQDFTRPHKPKQRSNTDANYATPGGSSRKPTLSLEDLLKTPPTTGPFGRINFPTPGSTFCVLEDETSLPQVELSNDDESSVLDKTDSSCKSRFPSNFSPTVHFLSWLTPDGKSFGCSNFSPS